MAYTLRRLDGSFFDIADDWPLANPAAFPPFTASDYTVNSAISDDTKLPA
jgi:hypothetical protein